MRLSLPDEMIAGLQPFAPAFRRRIWERAQVLAVGAILAPGQRTVAAARRVMGLGDGRRFQDFHRAVNRARWASLDLSPIRLRLLRDAFVPQGAPVIVGIDEQLARRRGAKVAATGIDRDPIRSRKGFFVKASGRRWVSLRLLAPIAWARRVWGLPSLTALAPSARHHRKRGKRHKTLPDRGRPMLLRRRRWLPDRPIIAVADRTYAAPALLSRCRRRPRPITGVTRLRLDAALSAPPPPRTAGTKGRPRGKGPRQSTLQARWGDPRIDWQHWAVRWYGGTGRASEVATGTALRYHGGLPAVAWRGVLIRDPAGKFAPQALLRTDPGVAPQPIVAWFVRRWPLEVTFHAARACLGVETQRQWNDRAIARCTPALPGLFSLVTLAARQWLGDGTPPTRATARYATPLPTFADTLALVRQHLWPVAFVETSHSRLDMVEIPRAVLERFTATLAFAA